MTRRDQLQIFTTNLGGKAAVSGCVRVEALESSLERLTACERFSRDPDANSESMLFVSSSEKIKAAGTAANNIRSMCDGTLRVARRCLDFEHDSSTL